MKRRHYRGKKTVPISTVYICLISLIFILPSTQYLTAADSSKSGQLLRETIKSKSLSGNLLGDPAERSVLIYLPPSYNNRSRERFPVLYLLHGYGKTNSGWIEGSYGGFNIKTELDAQINKGTINDMIVVMPDANNKYNGSYYGNSPVTGDWEGFIANELVATIDKEYRTLPNRENRGIAGHSMGAFGALRLAVTYPEKFSAVYSMSPAPIVLQSQFHMLTSRIKNEKINLSNFKKFTRPHQFNKLHWFWQSIIAFAAAYSPNTENPPFYVDLPFTEMRDYIVPVEKTKRRWMEYDPYILIDTHRQNYLKLKIAVDIGTSDKALPLLRQYHTKLTEAEIPHQYEEYEGDHNNSIHKRIKTKLLHFFSNAFLSKAKK